MTPVRRGSGVSQPMHDAHLAAVAEVQAKAAEDRAAEDAKVQDLYAKALDAGVDTTEADIREALRATARATKAQVRQRRADAAALLVEPPSAGRTVDDVRRWGEALRAPDGSAPTLDLVAERMGVTARWVSALCSEHGGYKSVVPNRKS